MNKKYLYWAFQSSQSLNPTEQEKKVFQKKYKKDFEHREFWEGDELLNKMRLNGWRNPMFSEITSIILAYENGNEMRVKYITGFEKDLLQNFINLLKNNFQEYDLVHFDSGIVLPYLGVRLNKNEFINTPHRGLKYQNEKPWTLDSSIDLKHYYKGAGDYSFSLEEIGFIFNIDVEDIIPYEDEFTYYNSNEFDLLKKSAIRKVEVMAEIWRKLNNLPKLNTVLVEEKVENVEVQKPKDWLKELYYTRMTEDVKKGLQERIFGKKKPTKAEKENLFEIIRGVWIQTDFESGNNDSKKVIEEKEKQIKELLEI